MQKNTNQTQSNIINKIFISFLLLIIIVLSTTVIYLILNKSTNTTEQETEEQTNTKDQNTNKLKFGQYELSLPDGWDSEGTVESIISSTPVTDCLENPSEEDFNVPDATLFKDCKYAIINNSKYEDLEIKITDTDKVALGGGGYITTYTEKLNLKSGDLNGEFEIVWEGKLVDPQDPDSATEQLLINNKPSLYYITGSLQNDLYLHVNIAHTMNESNEYDKEYVDEFKNFINNLIISN